MATLGGYLESKQDPLQLSKFQRRQKTLTPHRSPLEKVLVVTADSRILVGTLSAADQSTNLVRLDLSRRPPLDPEADLPTSLPIGPEQCDGAHHPRARR